MKADFGFLQEQMPDGKTSNSSSRLVFLVGWFFLLIMIGYMVWTQKIDLGLIATVAGIVSGQKLYQKYLESQNAPESLNKQQATETKAP